MVRNFKNKLNYKITKTSTKNDTSSVHKFNSRKEVEDFVHISATTILRMIKQDTKRLIGDNTYKIARICDDLE